MQFGSLLYYFRQYVDDETVIMKNESAHSYLLECLDIGYAYVISIEDYKKMLDGIIDAEQLNIITYLLFDNICSYINIFPSIKACENFEAGIIKQGLVVIILRYLQNIRLSFEEHQTAKENDDIEYDFFNSDTLFNCCKLSYNHRYDT